MLIIELIENWNFNDSFLINEAASESSFMNVFLLEIEKIVIAWLI